MTQEKLAQPTLDSDAQMKREIDWRDAVWIVSSASSGVLLSIGSIAASVGPPSWLVWTGATLLALLHMPIYAEISGLFPNRSGGVSVYGAVAWQRYGKFFAPLNIWCNWLGWMPSGAVVGAIAGSYIVSAFFSNTPFASFSWTLLDLSAFLPGIMLKLDGSIVSGAVVMLLAFLLQHSGVLRMTRWQALLVGLTIVPLLILTIVPVLTGKINWSYFSPFLVDGTTSWSDPEAFRLVMGGLFIASWTTFSCEITMCYVREFKTPQTDTVRATIASGLVSLFAYGVLPFVFVGVVGMSVLRDPEVVAGNPQIAILKMADMTLGTGLGKWIAVDLILVMLLMIVPSIASSSRTLYQASLEGWLPKYLSRVNRAGSPVGATWTDFTVNMLLLLLGNPLFVLAASNMVYLTGVLFNLTAAWIHRVDRPHYQRPYRAPNWIMYGLVPILLIMDFSLIVFGANVFEPNTILYGSIGLLSVIPLFWYRHYFVDKGVWPQVVHDVMDAETLLP
jgi:amino acid transporter